MSKPFVSTSNPILTKRAKEIPFSKISSQDTQEIINTMLKVAFGEQKNRKRPVLVGLAAPQIGILKRIILVDVGADGKGRVGDLRVYINPQITWRYSREGEWYEGCYSTSKVCGIVSRPKSIKISGFELIYRFVNRLPIQFRQITQKHTGYVARIFQHEIDHLDGIRFPDLIKDPDKLHWVLKKEFPLYRDKQAWKNWPRKCSFETWKKIKGMV